MCTRRWLLGLVVCSIPFFADAQEKPKEKMRSNTSQKWEDSQQAKAQPNSEVKVKWANSEKVEAKLPPPPWAPAQDYNMSTHIYFPDYYTFYDPTRGYVYWQKDQWVFSLSAPEYLTSVDLKTARIQRLNDIRLNDLPERQYMIYSHQYPAQAVNESVPVPDLR